METRVALPEYLGDVRLEQILPLLENINRNVNSIPLILDQYRGVNCIVRAEIEHTIIPREEWPTDPTELMGFVEELARNRTFKRLVIEPEQL